MMIYVVGNSLKPNDSVPLQLIKPLQRIFPQCHIEEVDPNENFVPEGGSVIIDTVEGIKGVTIFHNIDAFVTTKSVSPHDYDLGFHLKLLFKLRKISTITILGIPADASMEKILRSVESTLKKLMNKIERKREK